MVIHAAQHHDADAVLALQLVQRLAGLAANLGLAIEQGLESGVQRAFIFFAGKTQYRTPGLKHLVGTDSLILQIQDWIEVTDPIVSEDFTLLGKGRFDYLRRGGHRRASIGTGQVDQRGMQHVVHREPDRVQWLLAVLGRDEIVNVRDANL